MTINKELERMCAIMRNQLEEYAYCHERRFPMFDLTHLTNMCSSAALLVHSILLRSGIVERSEVLIAYNTLTYDAGCHCWVYADGLHIDLTATQFGGPEVYISREPYLANPDRVFNCDGSIDGSYVVVDRVGCVNGEIGSIRAELLEDHGWPDGQIIETSGLYGMVHLFFEELHLDIAA